MPRPQLKPVPRPLDHLDPAKAKDLIDAAVEVFGTSDCEDAGFLLPDGRWIDLRMSDEYILELQEDYPELGDLPNNGFYDHDIIDRAYRQAGYRVSGLATLPFLEDTGSARVIINSSDASFQSVRPPTERQLQALGSCVCQGKHSLWMDRTIPTSSPHLEIPKAVTLTNLDVMHCGKVRQAIAGEVAKLWEVPKVA
jgi:hypothetical protein